MSMSTAVLTDRMCAVDDYIFTSAEIESARSYENEIAAFESSDVKSGVTSGGVVFLGSSTFTLWLSLVRTFQNVVPCLPLFNRGFGGSEVSDSLYYCERVLLPLAPRAVFFYAGDNDLAHGKSPQRVLDGTKALCERTWQSLPDTKFFLVSVKPSPSRWHIFDLQIQTNELLRAYCADDGRLTFVDITTPMLDKNGEIRPELYVADELHLSLAGYRIWREVFTPYLAALT
jgi:lysophospholipase L1-like esterase